MRPGRYDTERGRRGPAVSPSPTETVVPEGGTVTFSVRVCARAETEGEAVRDGD